MIWQLIFCKVLGSYNPGLFSTYSLLIPGQFYLSYIKKGEGYRGRVVEKSQLAESLMFGFICQMAGPVSKNSILPIPHDLLQTAFVISRGSRGI